MTSAKPKQIEGIMVREVGEDLMVYDAPGRAIHVLSPTAQFIWEHCDGEHAVDDIVREAVEHYEADESIVRPDIEETLATFRDLGIIAD